MSFLISTALAQEGGAGAQQPGLFMNLLPLIIIIVLFYFILIRPQMRRAKEHKQMVANLQRGDEVVTNGGLLGQIEEVGESFVTLKVADNLSIKVQKHAVASVMPKGTMKNA